MNYYQFHIGDFRSGTFNMSRQARWIYRDMLDVYYDTEAPLQLDFELLCDELGVESDDERRIVDRILRLKFERTDDGYRHATCDRVIDEYRARAATAKANGSLGGRPKGTSKPRKKPSGFSAGYDSDASGLPAGGPLGGRSQANQEPLTSKPITKEETPLVEPDGPTDLFPEGLDVKPPAAVIAVPGNSAGLVFDHWRRVMNSPRSALDAKRKGAIDKALRIFTVEQLCQAIDGCALTPHNMGLNERATKYNDIELICRNAANVERFMASASAPPVSPGFPRPMNKQEQLEANNRAVAARLTERMRREMEMANESQ
jgi:uncharacterized protein YdaU (DUF1376 family)